MSKVPQVGQIWRSRDRRDNMREVKITRIDNGYAYVVPVNPPVDSSLRRMVLNWYTRRLSTLHSSHTRCSWTVAACTVETWRIGLRPRRYYSHETQDTGSFARICS